MKVVIEADEWLDAKKRHDRMGKAASLFSKKVARQHPEVKSLEVRNSHPHRPRDITLDTIEVNKASRSKGTGSAVMKKLTKFADKHKSHVELSLAHKNDGMGTTSSGRLRKFYAKHGFKNNKGRNKRYDLSMYTNMYRKPGTKTEALHPDRVNRLRKLAKYSRGQKALSSEFSKQADHAQGNWFKHAATSGSIGRLGNKSEPDKSQSYEIAKSRQRMGNAAMRVSSMEKDSHKAAVRSDRAKDMVKAYGHPNKFHRIVGKSNLASHKFWAAAGEGDHLKDHPSQKPFAAADSKKHARVANQPAGSEGRANRIANLKKASDGMSPKFAKAVLGNHKNKGQVIARMTKIRKILTKRSDQHRIAKQYKPK